MGKRVMWLVIPALIGLGTMAARAGVGSDEPAQPKKMTAEDAIKLWSPKLKNATDYQQWGGSPQQSANVAAFTFRVVGPTFEELWNHYARLCGMKERYKEKTFLVSADAGLNGSYVVSDRASADGKAGRGPTVFLLKTDGYTVTVTFQPDSDGKSISGSLTAVVP
jgi:hypothetical protein